MKLKKICAGFISATMFATSIGGVNVLADDKPTIFIVGDSTACEYGSDDNYAVPRAGWGMYLDKFVTGADVVDLAKSGRSSKSLTVEEEYQTLLKDMGEGDYLLIQFGHNDAKKSSEEDLQTRYTDPEGDKDTEGSFKNSLYENYIKVAEDKGATPILLTPIPRRSFEEDGSVKDTHGLYDDAIIELAEEVNVPLVDVNKDMTYLYNQLGEEFTASFHAIYKDTAKGDKGHDNTHLNHFGARFVAFGVASNLSVIEGINKYITDNEGFMNSYITRGEFTYEVVRIIGGDYSENKEDSFIDVDKDSEYSAAIATAKAMGIVTGDELGNFNPDGAINLQQMCAITARALKYCNIELDDSTEVIDKLIKADELKPYAVVLMANILNLWGEVVPLYANPREIMSYGDAFTMYCLLYDEINEVDEDAVAQSIDEVEKVE